MSEEERGRAEEEVVVVSGRAETLMSESMGMGWGFACSLACLPACDGGVMVIGP